MSDQLTTIDPVIAHLWNSVPYLSGLPPDTIQALAAAATTRTYQAGEVIFLEDDPVAGLFLIEHGVVKISRFSKEGREHILHLLQRGDTFNDVAALDGGTNPATAIAHTGSTLWRITRDDLHWVAERHPELAWALIESIARRARAIWLPWSKTFPCATSAAAWLDYC